MEDATTAEISHSQLWQLYARAIIDHGEISGLGTPKYGGGGPKGRRFSSAAEHPKTYMLEREQT